MNAQFIASTLDPTTSSESASAQAPLDSKNTLGRPNLVQRITMLNSRSTSNRFH